MDMKSHGPQLQINPIAKRKPKLKQDDCGPILPILYIGMAFLVTPGGF